MAALLNIGKWWSRRLRSRGFGVHSPFAYRFITEVLHQQYSYYAYEIIVSDLQRLLFRIIVDLRPHRVAVYASQEMAEAVLAASRNIVVAVAEPEFVVLDYKAACDDERTRCMTDIIRGASAMILNADTGYVADILSQLEQGMSFNNGRGVVVIVNKKLPRQDFDVFF